MENVIGIFGFSTFDIVGGPLLRISSNPMVCLIQARQDLIAFLTFLIRILYLVNYRDSANSEGYPRLTQGC